MAKRYVKFGSAWLKQTQKDGKEFISVSVKSKGEDSFVNKEFKTGKVTKTKLWLQQDNGEPVQIDGFSVFPTNSDKERFPNAPDFEVTISYEE